MYYLFSCHSVLLKLKKIAWEKTFWRRGQHMAPPTYSLLPPSANKKNKKKQHLVCRQVECISTNPFQALLHPGVAAAWRYLNAVHQNICLGAPTLGALPSSRWMLRRRSEPQLQRVWLEECSASGPTSQPAIWWGWGGGGGVVVLCVCILPGRPGVYGAALVIHSSRGSRRLTALGQTRRIQVTLLQESNSSRGLHLRSNKGSSLASPGVFLLLFHSPRRLEGGSPVICRASTVFYVVLSEPHSVAGT